MSVVAEIETAPAAQDTPAERPARATGRRAEQAGALDRPTVSFELFPPRNPDAAPRLWATVRELETVEPDFVSVTYGASGRTRQTTRALVRRLLRETSLNPIAHLTCVGTSRDEVTAIVEEFLDEGVRSFLALRGDPPAGEPDWRPHPDGVDTAAELVELLRDIEKRRCGRSAAQAVRARVRPLSVAVAAFPRGNHATGGTRAQDVQALLAKQEAGADFAISQVFFDAEAYLGLVAEAREAGVTIPIVPGIIPTTDPARLARVQELTGVPVPGRLLDLLSATDDPAERHRRGTRAGVDLVNRVLDGGAPGVHVYTFNKHEAALDLLEGADLVGGRRSAVTPHDLTASDGSTAGATTTTTPRGNLS
ncbi:methylenetetrahydrofolate reductase [Cellulomonas dongxiuzhuiae]|uniref:Methylenetetrahydrofolate reductase n=1 Tax=Cellulomonas dongxiuzhuiae TaxID=2819979 RepID=A0ABX8GNE9_9CELL|nr:methylenetetrahydrofolate reductase [Cellulomonas dongxiuzhuiae]MBO3089563.1 methylenetetrahydrofolate reductase [Cellulomonas dongxiuzhuiae]MBO3095199.1 methylenetetrahydrofolate reductase [Cellulomonas dongxiuzhuiae]QWC17664.1 methylenetetrahydrofolate reductase [Cellulomonas dongxiuzhuiae]